MYRHTPDNLNTYTQHRCKTHMTWNMLTDFCYILLSGQVTGRDGGWLGSIIEIAFHVILNSDMKEDYMHQAPVLKSGWLAVTWEASMILLYTWKEAQLEGMSTFFLIRVVKVDVEHSSFRDLVGWHVRFACQLMALFKVFSRELAIAAGECFSPSCPQL